MATAEQYQPTTIRTLYETVTRYIDDNKRSRDVNERWLCDNLEPILGRISGVLNSKVPDKDRPLVAAFRAAEIEKEITGKRQEIERLERDLASTKP